MQFLAMWAISDKESNLRQCGQFQKQRTIWNILGDLVTVALQQIQYYKLSFQTYHIPTGVILTTRDLTFIKYLIVN